MAKLIKTSKRIKDGAVKKIARDLPLFNNIFSSVYHLFDLDKENVFIIMIKGQKVMGIEPISMSGTGSAGSVGIDFDKVEEVLDAVTLMGASYMLCHNHPYMTGPDGKWMETLVSSPDVTTTENIVTNAHKYYPDVEYLGHVIVNKEPDADKIIFMDTDYSLVKYSKEVIEMIQKGEL